MGLFLKISCFSFVQNLLSCCWPYVHMLIICIFSSFSHIISQALWVMISGPNSGFIFEIINPPWTANLSNQKQCRNMISGFPIPWKYVLEHNPHLHWLKSIYHFVGMFCFWDSKNNFKVSKHSKISLMIICCDWTQKAVLTRAAVSQSTHYAQS